MTELASMHTGPSPIPTAACGPSFNSKVRVVRIIDRLNIGGPSKHVVWLTSGLNSAEFDTVLITGTVPPGEGDMSYFASAAGVHPLVIDQMSREVRPRDVVVIAKLLWQLLKLRPDIIHTHKAKAGAVGRVAAMIYKWATPSILRLQPRHCKIVHTYHGHYFHGYFGRERARLFIAIERRLARSCTDALIVLSEQQLREICGAYHIGRPEQFRVIPLGIDLEEIQKPGSADELDACPTSRQCLRNQLGVSEHETAIGITGRLCDVKNHGMFLRAAARMLRDSSVRARFVVIGDGYLRSDLERQSTELGISDVVAFTGFRQDAASLCGALDVVALTSLNEGTPLAIIEAMGCGRAVAATEVGGVLDLMGARHHSVGGFTVWDHGVTAPSGDVEGFARALRFLAERPELRTEMGKAGRALVTARLSTQRLLQEIERLYRELSGFKPERPYTEAS
jgi:glycosyltransferase involved in cell wall biosynthesis